MFRLKSLAFISIIALSGCEVDSPQIAVNTVNNNNAAIRLSSTDAAVTAFISACVNTTSNPNAAPAVLESLGFRQTGTRNGAMKYTSSFATASVSTNTRGGGLGQCTVTPRSASFSNVVSQLNTEIITTNFTVRKLGGEEAWLIGGTGAVALVSRQGGAMTRTQPNVFRG